MQTNILTLDSTLTSQATPVLAGERGGSSDWGTPFSDEYHEQINNDPVGRDSSQERQGDIESDTAANDESAPTQSKQDSSSPDSDSDEQRQQIASDGNSTPDDSESVSTQNIGSELIEEPVPTLDVATIEKMRGGELADSETVEERPLTVETSDLLQDSAEGEVPLQPVVPVQDSDAGDDVDIESQQAQPVADAEASLESGDSTVLNDEVVVEPSVAVASDPSEQEVEHHSEVEVVRPQGDEQLVLEPELAAEKLDDSVVAAPQTTADNRAVAAKSTSEVESGATVKGEASIKSVTAASSGASAGSGGEGGSAKQGGETAPQLAASTRVDAPTDTRASTSGFASQLSSAVTSGVTSAAGNPSSASTSPPLGMTLATSIHQPGWDRAMGERVVWMVRNNLQQAQIQLNPRDMGPIDIRLSVNADQQTSVTFVANHAATRESLEAALPRLREMFQEAGMELSDSEVSQREHQGEERAEERAGRQTGSAVGDEESEGDEGDGIEHVSQVSAAGLDTFA